MSLFRDLYRRLRLGWKWVIAQFVGIPLLFLLGLVWTRLPEKHIWQVAASLLFPLLLLGSLLILQAGTMRRLMDDAPRRVRRVWGASTLLVWIAIGWACWAVLDWCDDRIPQWAGYLNSQLSPHWRARLLTYNHIQSCLTWIEWILRWLVVPAKIIPYAAASALWGWRIPWMRVIRMLWNWRWWLAVLLSALAAVALPAHFFTAEPHGTVSAQVWLVAFKLTGAYLLAIVFWVLLLGWLAVLFGRQPKYAENKQMREIATRLRAARGWIWALFGWSALSVLDDLFLAPLPETQSWVKMVAAIVLILAGLVLAVGMVRSLIGDHAKRVRMVFATLSVLLWGVAALGISLLLTLWHLPIAPWVTGWVITPAILLPFAAASALWGLRLPWRRVIKLPLNWQWWLGVFAAAILGVALPALIDAATRGGSEPPSLWGRALRECVNGLLATGALVLLLAWLAVLFGSGQPPDEEQPVPALAPGGPPAKHGKAAVDPPSSENG